MEFICDKCTPPHKLKTLMGWKQHQSGMHGGYSEEELKLAAGIGVVEGVQSRMNRFSETLDDGTPKIDPSGTPPAQTNGGQSPPTPIFVAPVETGRRIKATPKKLKKVLGDIPAKILEAQGIKLDSDDEDTLEEAAEMLSDIFGVEFAVPQSKYTIESRFFALLWVLAVTGIVWAKHRAPQVWSLLSKEKVKGDVEQNNGNSRTEG